MVLQYQFYIHIRVSWEDMVHSHDSRISVTGTNPDFYPTRDGQLGSISRNYLRNIIFYHYNNNKVCLCIYMACFETYCKQFIIMNEVRVEPIVLILFKSHESIGALRLQSVLTEALLGYLWTILSAYLENIASKIFRYTSMHISIYLCLQRFQTMYSYWIFFTFL